MKYGSPKPVPDARIEIRQALEARRPEIEQAVLTRVYAISDAAHHDPTYLYGLRVAVLATIDYCLTAIDCSERRMPAVPAPLISQAGAAARNNVSLDTVLRRCFGGYALFADFLVQEAEESDLPCGVLKRLLAAQTVFFDRIIQAVSEEHGREAANRASSSRQHRAKQVERLLQGELIDTVDLAYDFEAVHLGLVVVGAGAVEAIHDITAARGCLHLIVRRDRETIWAWLGARDPIDAAELSRDLCSVRSPSHSLAIGEPGKGLSGWRLTHRQAKSVLPLAQGTGAARYADVALLATILRDDVLVASLHQLYLDPLERHRDGGDVARETLRAYFATDRNVSSAAAALGVNRRTVTNRIRAIEKGIGRSINSCAVDLEMALRINELDGANSAREDTATHKLAHRKDGSFSH